MRLQPAPLTTKLVEGSNLTSTWTYWFRNLSKNLVDSCTVQRPNASVNYVVNGATLHLIASGTGSINIQLPYDIACDQMLQLFVFDTEWKSAFIDVTAGSKKIEYTTSLSWKINAVLMISQIN